MYHRRVESKHEAVAAVELAMVKIRRRQSRRSLRRLAEREQAAVPDPAGSAVVDALEELQEVGLEATVSAVAERLGVDSPRASRLVARAVAAGLARREADQRDGRRSLLTLTAAGRAHAAHLHAFRREAFERAMADWEPGDAAAFARLLTRFVRGLESAGGRRAADQPEPP